MLASSVDSDQTLHNEASDQHLQGGYKLEFGNALKQEVTSAKATDPEFLGLLEFVQQYTQKRFPWSVPRSLGKQGTTPEVISLRKLRLIYAPDDTELVYYDDVVTDKSGREHGMTSFITLGTTYRFIIRWRENKLSFTHNVTISLYPTPTDINVYSHSCFVQNSNDSNIQGEKYLLPKYHNWRQLEKVQDLQPNELYHHLEEFDVKLSGVGGSLGHVTEFTQSEACADESCTFGGEKTGEFKYAKFLSKQFLVMTYNIWNMNPASPKMYEKRMKRLIKTIELADPDIIGLQEVRYEETKGGAMGPSQIQTLSERLPQYQFVYEPAQMQGSTLTEGKSEEGVAIMSKYPIISHDHKLLYINRSDGADGHQRVLLHAQIYIPLIGKVHVLNTHFSLSHVAREKCVVEIWKYARDLEGPVVLTGDFNAEPQEPSIQYLCGKDVFPGEERSQFVDTWLQNNKPDDHGNTFSALETNATKRIDYIFYKAGNQCCKLDKCEVLDDGKKGSKAASDHLPVMATFTYEDHIKTN